MIAKMRNWSLWLSLRRRPLQTVDKEEDMSGNLSEGGLWRWIIVSSAELSPLEGQNHVRMALLVDSLTYVRDILGHDHGLVGFPPFLIIAGLNTSVDGIFRSDEEQKAVLTVASGRIRT